MDEATRMQLHDLAAIRRCCDDALLYAARLAAAQPPLPQAERTVLCELHIPRLRMAREDAALMARRLRDGVTT